MRITLAVPLFAFALLAAAAALPAQKPPPDDTLDTERDSYRGQGISLCVADLRAADELTPDDLEAICGCALDRLMTGRPAEALPRLEPGGLRPVIGAQLLSCAVEREPRLAAAVGRRLAESASTLPAPVAEPPPVDTDTGAAPDKPAPSEGFNPGRWLDGVSMPRWLTGTGLPFWAWLPIGLIAIVLLRALFRRREGRDLLGPPPHMRPGARSPHLPPRG